MRQKGPTKSKATSLSTMLLLAEPPNLGLYYNAVKKTPRLSKPFPNEGDRSGKSPPRKAKVARMEDAKSEAKESPADRLQRADKGWDESVADCLLCGK